MGGQGRDKGSKNRSQRLPSVRIGETHGAWKIIDHEGLRYSKKGSHSYHYWVCECRFCGKIMPRSTSMLKGNKEGKGNGCDCLMVKPNAAINKSFRTYKRFAKLRSLSFDLAFDEFADLISLPCAYCGKEPEINSYSDDAIVKVPMNGIDRRDSSKSYTKENCVPCCTMCNLAKLDYPEEIFVAWVKRVVKFQSREDPTLGSWSRFIDHTPVEPTFGVPKPEEELEWEATIDAAS